MNFLIAVNSAEATKRAGLTTNGFEKVMRLAEKLKGMLQGNVKIFHSQARSALATAEAIKNFFDLEHYTNAALDPPVKFSDIKALIARYENSTDTIVLVGDPSVISFIGFYAKSLGVDNSKTYDIKKGGAYLLDIAAKKLQRMKKNNV